MQELSVIMTTYNENLNFLKNCINSVLLQTFNNFDFIIVVEPDETNMNFLESVASMDKRVTILKNKTKSGISGSRNRAIQESSGEYIAIIDGDDYCDLSRFEKQLKFLENNPGISVVGSNMYLIDEDNNIIGERRYPEVYRDIKRSFLLTMPIANPAVMTRKKDLIEVGYFNSTFSKSEDFELWLRFLVKNKKMYNLLENLLYYRVPLKNNIKRSRLHWKNNYIARKRHSRFIWPIHKRFYSLFLYFFISKIPGIFLNNLLNLKITNRTRNIKINRD
jgi:glycosyltransferase involved in cell wall biosynthesis